MAVLLDASGDASQFLRGGPQQELVDVHIGGLLDPNRVLANAFVNTAWRNGPVESIHAGGCRGHPLEQRRVTLAEERALMAFASERFAQAMSMCLRFMVRDRRRWWERIASY